MIKRMLDKLDTAKVETGMMFYIIGRGFEMFLLLVSYNAKTTTPKHSRFSLFEGMCYNTSDTLQINFEGYKKVNKF